MSVAFELENPSVPPLGCTSCRTSRRGPHLPPTVRRRRVVLAAVAVRGVCWSFSPCRSGQLGGSTLAQAQPTPGQEYMVKTGDTLASIAARADPSRCQYVDGTAGPRGRLDRRGPGGAHPHSLTIVSGVRCPWCGVDDDRVVDSRQAEDGGAIRRRRECLGCGRRFTTFERIEEVPLWVVKRTGLREPFDRAKVIEGVRAACKNRPVTDEQMEELAQGVEDALRAETTEPTSQQVGRGRAGAAEGARRRRLPALCQRLQGIRGGGDFQREAGLLTKTTEPKRKKRG